MSRAALKAILIQFDEEKLRAILRDFYRRMASDVLIGFFFTDKDTDLIAEHQLRFLKFASGMVGSYDGKSPTSAHLELPPILSGHFDRRLVLLRETLKDHALPQSSIEQWIEFENAFRSVVVNST